MNAFTAYINNINAFDAVSNKTPNNAQTSNVELAKLLKIQYIDVLKDKFFNTSSDDVEGYGLNNVGAYNDFINQLRKIDQRTLSKGDSDLLTAKVEVFTVNALKTFYSRIIDRTDIEKYPIKVEKFSEYIDLGDNKVVRPYVEKYVANEALINEVSNGDGILCYEIPSGQWMMIQDNYHIEGDFIKEEFLEEDVYNMIQNNDFNMKLLEMNKFDQMVYYNNQCGKMFGAMSQQEIGFAIEASIEVPKEKYANKDNVDVIDFEKSHKEFIKEIYEEVGYDEEFSDMIQCVPFVKFYYERKDSTYRLFTILKLVKFCENQILPILNEMKDLSGILKITRDFVEEVISGAYFEHYTEEQDYINGFYEYMDSARFTGDISLVRKILDNINNQKIVYDEFGRLKCYMDRVMAIYNTVCRFINDKELEQSLDINEHQDYLAVLEQIHEISPKFMTNIDNVINNFKNDMNGANDYLKNWYTYFINVYSYLKCTINEFGINCCEYAIQGTEGNIRIAQTQREIEESRRFRQALKIMREYSEREMAKNNAFINALFDF